MEKNTALANVLKALRKSKGVTQDQLAGSVNLSKHTIVSYENGLREPTGKALAALEQYFGVTGAYLFGLTNDPQPAAPPEPVPDRKQRRAQKDLAQQLEHSRNINIGMAAVLTISIILNILLLFAYRI